MNKLSRLNNSFIIFVLVVFALVIVSLFYNLANIDEKYNKMVLEHAKNAFQKDLMFRKWVASHGGVYVFPTESTPPNPYLAHIPERDLITTTGQKLTLMNPAYTLRELMENFSGMYGQKGHITSLQLLNPKNRPDEWETKVLKQFDKKRFTEYHEIYDYKGSEHLRYMKALEVKASCLKCHAHQGYKVGDIRGGVSITIPMTKYNEDGILEKENELYLHLFLLSFLLFFIYLVYQKMKKTLLREESLNDELKRQDQIMVEQSKMASLGEMLANIAHQWRQPLSIISTSASGVKINNELKTLDDKLLNDSMDSIVKSAQYLSNTIEDFRNFIKNDKQKEHFCLKQNIQNNLKILAGTIKNHFITVELQIEEDIEINSYPNELTQVFINLINNAKDAFIQNEVKEKYIFITLFLENDMAVIQIKDNAGGIKKKILPKIFDPYFTTKHKSQGTGLGLYMSHRIINESMHGTIEVQNVKFEYQDKKYKGAQFTLHLPREF